MDPECQKSFEKIKKTPECQKSFEKIKKALTSDLSLTHYEPTLDIIVAIDASSYGILHKLPHGSWKAVAHASRSLLPAEKQYSQIEKDALGIIFAVTKFHRYLHGSRFILQTDHKPLITIFGVQERSASLYCKLTTSLGNDSLKLQLQDRVPNI